MTDEETDDDDNGVLIKRSPKWRHEKLTQLLSKLDKKYVKGSTSEKSRPLKPRKLGPYSERKPPANAPKWAIVNEEISDSVSTGSTEGDSPSTSESSLNITNNNAATVSISYYIHMYG